MTDLTTRLAQAQLDAYNAHDIQSFAACYHPDVEVFDLGGELRFRGRERLVETYGPIFQAKTSLRAELVGRLVVGDTAVDQERVTGLVEGEVVHALAIYKVREGLIAQVWFVRGPSPQPVQPEPQRDQQP